MLKVAATASGPAKMRQSMEVCTKKLKMHALMGVWVRLLTREMILEAGRRPSRA
jgi:hypothetical protein